MPDNDGQENLPGIAGEEPLKPTLEEVTAISVEKDKKIADLLALGEKNSAELKTFKDAEKKRQESISKKEQKKEDELILSKDYEKLADNRQKELDILKSKNTELAASALTSQSANDELESVKKALINTVETTLSQYSTEHQKIIKGLSSWDDNDPIGQLAAITDFGKMPGSKTKMPVNYGTPGGRNTTQEQYNNLLKTGDTEGSLLMKLKHMN